MGSTRHSTPCREHDFAGFPAGVYRRSKRDESGKFIPYGKWQPRFKPPREKLAFGETLIHDGYLPLGGCNTPQGAKTLRHIAAFYYGKAGEVLDLGNGQFFFIPSMSEQDKQRLQGKEKVKWVSRKAREVFEDFEKEKSASSMRNGLLSSHEGATIIASSPVITGIEQLAAPSPEDSALNQSLEDIGSPQFDMNCNFDMMFDLHAPPSLSLEQTLGGIPTWPCGVDSNLSTGDVELDVNPILSPQQASEALGSEDTVSIGPHSSTMDVDLLYEDVNDPQLVHIQKQLEESKRQNLELQRQLLELQREMECVKSRLQQHCFCLCHIVYP